MTWWSNWRTRYEHLVEEYGSAAIATYLTLFASTWFGFWVAISYGFDVGSGAANAGTIGGAWVATKVTQPLRIMLTIGLTPIAVRIWRRFRAPRPPAP